MVEYPVTFLKLYKAIVENQNTKSDFIIHLRYQNIKGFILVPYAPGAYGFEFGYSDAIPYDENIIDIPNMSVPSDFDPNQISYELIKRVYRAFKLRPETIPFYDQETKKFSFS